MLRRILLFCLLLSLVPVANAQPRPSLPKVRAITAFVQIDRNNYKDKVHEAIVMLKQAKAAFEKEGYEVETVRVTTQPFPQYVHGMSHDDALAFLREYDQYIADSAQRDGQAVDAAVGPAMQSDTDDPGMAQLLAEALVSTKIINASLSVADQNHIHWRAVRAAAHVIKYASEHSPHSQATFNFAATANVDPNGPFYPGSYSSQDHAFAVGLEGASVVQQVFSSADISDPERAEQLLADALRTQAHTVDRVARRIAEDTKWRYGGFDPTPAPLKDISIGAAIEKFIGKPFGSPGTMTAARIITEAVQSVDSQHTGYSGLMLPILEDARLAQRWSERTFDMDSVLAYSAVCGTGFDTIPLPGDVTEDQLARIIGDMATLSVKWKKPLTARLQPVAGKKAGERSDFNDPYLVNAVLQPLP